VQFALVAVEKPRAKAPGQAKAKNDGSDADDSEGIEGGGLQALFEFDLQRLRCAHRILANAGGEQHADPPHARRGMRDAGLPLRRLRNARAVSESKSDREAEKTDDGESVRVITNFWFLLSTVIVCIVLIPSSKSQEAKKVWVICWSRAKCWINKTREPFSVTFTVKEAEEFLCEEDAKHEILRLGLPGTWRAMRKTDADFRVTAERAERFGMKNLEAIMGGLKPPAFANLYFSNGTEGEKEKPMLQTLCDICKQVIPRSTEGDEHFLRIDVSSVHRSATEGAHLESRSELCRTCSAEVKQGLARLGINW
jgi:hypothetical protein